MITDQFKKDYRQLVAQGVEFTPEDIVRLNALSVKARLSRTAAHSVHLPRLAFMPRDSWWHAPIVLREPTIAHSLWLERAAEFIDPVKGRNWLFLHGFALSRRADALPDAAKPRKVISAVYGFAKKRLARFTEDQLSAAVDYALYGADWTACEFAPQKKPETEDDGRDPGRPSPTIGLLTSARVMRLPITLDEARGMTSSELQEAIMRGLDWDERFDPDRSHAKAFADYVRAREEIRNRKKAVEDGVGE